MLALLRLPYYNEKHLCDALREGIKQRALNLHRDERSHEKILADNAPAIHAAQQARSADQTPEQLALAREDRLLITEFLAELTGRNELRVFWLVTEGMGYNRIAKILKIEANEARNTVAACERKRERFQKLHDSGRLCGYRAATIKALLEGQAASPELVGLAVAHVARCARCQAEHETNAKRLRRAFEEQAAALIPPAFTTHLGWLTRSSIQSRTLAQRLYTGLVLRRAGRDPRTRRDAAGGWRRERQTSRRDRDRRSDRRRRHHSDARPRTPPTTPPPSPRRETQPTWRARHCPWSSRCPHCRYPLARQCSLTRRATPQRATGAALVMSWRAPTRRPGPPIRTAANPAGSPTSACQPAHPHPPPRPCSSRRRQPRIPEALSAHKPPTAKTHLQIRGAHGQ